MKKNQAIKLRKKGLTYNKISQELSIPKSTLFSWFKDLPDNEKIKKKNYSEAQKIWSKTLTDYNLEKAKESKKRAAQEQKKATLSIKKFNDEKLKILGAALYWAEGYKKSRWNLTFSNSDPEMIRIMMKFFLETCLVPLVKIKGQVQLHPNISQKKAEKYWQQISGIPIKQFRKPLIALTKSSKQVRNRNTLPYGTFRIIINDVHIVNHIKGWINGIIKQSSRDVV